LPAGYTIYKKVTVYHCGGRFWIVPYDATQSNVCDVPSDDRSWYPGWRALTFDHQPNSVSSVGFEHHEPRLATQTPNQAWRWQLLPEGYWADPPNGDTGGLQGEIAIILALAAFSAPRQQMALALDTSFKRGYWVRHNFVSGRKYTVLGSLKDSANGPPIGGDRRGVVVTVYVDPSSTAAQLRDFEEGLCGGPIFA